MEGYYVDALERESAFYEQEARESLKFHYTRARWTTYKQHYKAGSSLGMKIAEKALCLPASAVVLVMAVYRVAKAVFLGVPKGLQGDWTQFKLHLYTSLRRLQASTGSLIGIFNSRLGCYLLQESAFHLHLYQQYEKRSQSKKQPAQKPEDLREKTVFRDFTLYFPEEAKKMTLLTFKNMTLDQRAAVIDKFELQKDIDSINEKFDFFKRLDSLGDYALDCISIFDFRMYVKAKDSIE